MFQCGERKIHLVDTEGNPVAGVRVHLDVATPQPNFNYVGKPDGYEVVTDADGNAMHGWVPKWEKVHISDVNLVDSQWIYQSQTILGDKIEVVVTKTSGPRPHGGHCLARR